MLSSCTGFPPFPPLYLPWPSSNMFIQNQTLCLFLEIPSGFGEGTGSCQGHSLKTRKSMHKHTPVCSSPWPPLTTHSCFIHAKLIKAFFCSRSVLIYLAIPPDINDIYLSPEDRQLCLQGCHKEENRAWFKSGKIPAILISSDCQQNSQVDAQSRTPGKSVKVLFRMLFSFCQSPMWILSPRVEMA